MYPHPEEYEDTDEREDIDRHPGTPRNRTSDIFTPSSKKTKTRRTRRTRTATRGTHEDEENQVYYGAPLINAIVGIQNLYSLKSQYYRKQLARMLH